MEIDPLWLVGVVVLTALTVLVTGPGLWSEKWGWRSYERLFAWLGRRKRGGR
jgi:hypothetical protein